MVAIFSGEKAKNASGGRALKIGNHSDLYTWLQGKPREVAASIAARAVLRVLPFAASEIPNKLDADANKRFLNLTAAIFRATALVRVSVHYPTHPFDAPGTYASRAISASAASATSTFARTTAQAAASAVGASARSARSARAAVAAASTAASAVARAASAAFSAPALAAMWNEFNADAEFIDKIDGLTFAGTVARDEWLNRARALAASASLWSGRPPEPLDAYWRRLRVALPPEDDWQVWIDWYVRRINGVADPEVVELIYASVPQAEWDKGPGAANAWIKARLEEARWGVEQHDPPSLNDANITVPAPRPATLEPVIRAGKIALPEGTASLDLDAGAFVDALRALRALILDQADELEGEANIDKRSIALLRRIAQSIPDVAPTQAQLFILAHQQERLEEYGKKVIVEWPDVMASGYLSVVRAFDGTMRQFEKWRVFKQNALKDRLTEEQILQAAALARKLARALQSPENAARVDSAIPFIIDAMARDIEREDENAPPRDHVANGADTRPEDLITSIDNAFKRMGDAAAQSDEPESHLKKLEKGLGSQFDSEKFGENLGKWATNRLLDAGLAAGATGLALGTIYASSHTNELGTIIAQFVQLFPTHFQWLQPLIEILKRRISELSGR